MTEPSQHDLRVLHAYLGAQSRPALLRYGGITLAVVLLWLWICSRILGFGLSQRYQFLQPMGAQVQDMARNIGPYIWWGLVILLSLGVLSMLRAWIQARVDEHWTEPVQPGSLGELCRSLSRNGRDVLEWVWDDRDSPLTLGDLRRTRDELRHGRVAKFHLASEQNEILASLQDNDRNQAAAAATAPLAAAGSQRREPGSLFSSSSTPTAAAPADSAKAATAPAAPATPAPEDTLRADPVRAPRQVESARPRTRAEPRISDE